jgi:hypothetical protein
MSAFSAVVATLSLLLTLALLPVPGGIILAIFPLGLFALALLGVLAGLEDRTVRQHDPSMNPTAWRDGSRTAEAAGPRSFAPSRRAETSRHTGATRARSEAVR